MVDHILNMTPEIVSSYQLTVVGIFFILLITANLYWRKLVHGSELVLVMFLTLCISIYAVTVNLTDISSNPKLKINLIGYSPVKQNFSFRILKDNGFFSEKIDCFSPPQTVKDCVEEIELRKYFELEN
jgi:hypothetical protein